MLDFLKLETQKLHKQVEMSYLSKSILDHSITLNQYKQLLIHNYFCYKIVEQELVKKRELVDKELGLFISFEKSEKLLNDIHSIDPQFDLNLKIPFHVNSEFEIMGALYVIEGSMLGGSLINKHIKQCKYLETIPPQQFFNRNAKQVIKRWKLFTHYINTKAVTNKGKTEAVLLAKNTFELFDKVYTMV